MLLDREDSYYVKLAKMMGSLDSLFEVESTILLTFWKHATTKLKAETKQVDRSTSGVYLRCNVIYNRLRSFMTHLSLKESYSSSVRGNVIS